MARIETVEQLREIYKPPKGRAVEKVIHRLEKHSLRFLELSPFLVLSTLGEDGIADVSPRGEGPGFVQVLDDTTIAIPDRPGNNRIDTMRNIVANGEVGKIFFIPGVSEVLRINGDAEIRDDDDLRARFEVNGKLPATVIVIEIREIFLHCAKAIMRAALWDTETRIDRAQLPTMGQMLNDQTRANDPVESQAEMERRHEAVLY